MLLVALAKLSSRLSALLEPPHLQIDIVNGWSVGRNGCGSPFVTSTGGTNNMIVWVVGTETNGFPGDQRLRGYDGDTGDVVYDGGAANELMSGTHSYNTTGIAARGRIYVAGDNKVYAFTVPVGASTPTPTPTATQTPTPTPHPPQQERQLQRLVQHQRRHLVLRYSFGYAYGHS